MAAESDAPAQVEQAQTEGREGKYLTFVLGQEEYGLEILKVREIIGMLEITAVPQTPPFVKGVINLRGKVIPVVDLRLKFGMEEKEPTQETCIIVVVVDGVQMGIVVDTVNEVLDITEDQIEDPPRFGTSIDTDFIRGMGKVEGKVKILLDIQRVLTSDELVAVSEMAEG
jgi:purine-binding chemotaxis protein CheW